MTRSFLPLPWPLSAHKKTGPTGNRNRSMFFFILLSTCFCLPPAQAWADIKEVVLFPDSAQVVEEKTTALTMDPSGFLKTAFTLPAHTDPDSLSVRPVPDSGMTLVDLSWARAPAEESVEVEQLRRQINDLIEQKKEGEAMLQAVSSRIRYWDIQAGFQVADPDQMTAIANTLAENLQQAHEAKILLQDQAAELNQTIQELQAKLNKITGSRETIWAVSLLVEGPKAETIDLSLSYSLSGCGWTPLYRLQANPAEKRIQFTWEAEVWQSSGLDWKNVDLSLATLQPPTSIAPPFLPAWIIQPRPEMQIRPRQKAPSLSMDGLPSADRVETTAAAPELVRAATFSLWQLGRRHLLPGVKQRLTIEDHNWPATFAHLMRPALGDRAFIRAEVVLEESVQIPAGQALFLIDGALLGKETFSMNGRETTLYFGTDPMVTARSILAGKKSGERGIFGNRQSFSWEWKLLVTNQTHYPVTIRVEEPKPQIRDEKIKLSLELKPQPSEETETLLIWSFDLPAGAENELGVQVRVEAPKEMDLDLGWRR
jgi:uncharacterized protein (TIGR02231 family)